MFEYAIVFSSQHTLKMKQKIWNCMGKWKTISIVNLFNYSVIWNNIYAKCKKDIKEFFYALEIFEIIWLKFSYFLSSEIQF